MTIKRNKTIRIVAVTAVIIWALNWKWTALLLWHATHTNNLRIGGLEKKLPFTWMRVGDLTSGRAKDFLTLSPGNTELSTIIFNELTPVEKSENDSLWISQTIAINERHGLAGSHWTEPGGGIICVESLAGTLTALYCKSPQGITMTFKGSSKQKNEAIALIEKMGGKPQLSVP